MWIALKKLQIQLKIFINDIKFILCELGHNLPIKLKHTKGIHIRNQSNFNNF